jgi:maltokinase
VSPMLPLSPEQRVSLGRLMANWLTRHRGDGAHRVEMLEAEVLRSGRPGLLDVLAQVDGRLAHAVLGLRRPGQEQHFLRPGDEVVLGLLDDDHGMGVVVDALHDAELAPLVLASVTGDEAVPGGVAPVREDEVAVELAFGDACTLIVFPWLTEGPHPGVELLVGLDEAGFNHLAPPLALWRRGGRDLGLVQELPAGGAGGWALALTSLRDLLAAGVPPEEAGGDFASEARSLGTMTARMHLALDRAFGRRMQDVSAWVGAAERKVRAAAPGRWGDAEVDETVTALSSPGLRAPAVRAHGDFHLGRTARTDQGWVVADCMPAEREPSGGEGEAGRPGGEEGAAGGEGGAGAGGEARAGGRAVARAEGGAEARFRSPLADVADLLWSLHRVAAAAAAERDPFGQSGLGKLAASWEARNRKALMSGYLATPGIGGLVPADRAVVRGLAAIFELERAVSGS